VQAVRPVVVTGVLLAHHGAVWLKECLDALSLQTGPLNRLVIADTGSTGDSVPIAASQCSRWRWAQPHRCGSRPGLGSSGLRFPRRSTTWGRSCLA
jgi:GT2 family glycosyltransferase